MKLSEQDTKLFYKLNWGLLFFVNQKRTIIPNLKEPDFRGKGEENVSKLHDQLYSHSEWIDEFILNNPLEFSAEELEIIKSWKNFIKDRFFIVKHTKEGSIFLQPEKQPKAFAVLGLMDDPEDIFPYLPVVTETILLPFKGKITYSGFFKTTPISFGGGFKRGLNADLGKAKSKFGIITSLDNPITERQDADEELFKFYCSNEDNRFEYAEQIEKMIKTKPELSKTLSIEEGKGYARRVRKRFKALNIQPKTWFVLLENVIVGTGKTKEEAIQTANQILPSEKIGHTYVFQYKG